MVGQCLNEPHSIHPHIGKEFNISTGGDSDPAAPLSELAGLETTTLQEGNVNVG